MKTEKSRQKKPRPKWGFTFTVSIVLLSITLMAISSFAPGWRDSQNDVFSAREQSEGLANRERVSSDLQQLLGAGASVFRENSTAVKAVARFSFPFKEEGLPLLDSASYAAALPQALRLSDYELVFAGSQLSSGSADAVSLPAGGKISLAANGTHDIASIYHPEGWAKEAVEIEISCQKNATKAGEFSSPSSSGVRHLLRYSDGTGSYVRGAILPEGANSTLSIEFADGTVLFVESSSSKGAISRTSIHYTKSPASDAVLPFDEEARAGESTRDYSAENMTVELDASAPAWLPQCRQGGCYYFAGGTERMYSVAAEEGGAGGTYPEAEVQYPSGPQRLLNNGFESYSGVADDGVGDNFTGWSKVPFSQLYANTTIEATERDAFVGTALKATYTGAGSPDAEYVYQTLNEMWPRSRYTLSFWTKGDGSVEGRYAIMDSNTSKYLQSDGSWSSSQHIFLTKVPSAEFNRVVRHFSLPFASNSVRIVFFHSSSAGSVVYDEAELRRDDGLNGGFEAYASEEEFLSGIYRMDEPAYDIDRAFNPRTCESKPCDSHLDCAYGAPPYCGAGCNFLSGTCYPNPGEPEDRQNFCWPSGHLCATAPFMGCCQDTYCNAGTSTCDTKKACGAACSSGAECASNCSFCVLGACAACIPADGATACNASSQCCQGSLCDLGSASASFSRCVSCLPQNGAFCTSDSDCCSGLACRGGACSQNSAPGKPPTPSLSASAFNFTDLLLCASNCPPSTYPSDPQKDSPLTIQYRWYRNGTPMTSYWHGRSDFRCFEGTLQCSGGDFIAVRSRACDPYGSCNESSLSTSAIASGTSAPSCSGVGSICTGACCPGLACAYPDPLSASGNCCIPDNPTWGCTANSDCCSGLCEADPSFPSHRRCVESLSCGSACSSSLDCAANCSYCAEPALGGSATCRSCIPVNSTTQCSSGAGCCAASGQASGLCNLLPSSPAYRTCVDALPQGHPCQSDSQCASLRCQANSSGASQKACAPSLPSCSQMHASCLSPSDCCPSPPSSLPLSCDNLTRQAYEMAALKPTDARQVALNSLGACRSCYPEFFRCDPASGIRCCGDSRFSCRSGYCTPDSPTANKFTFASWGKTNDSEIFSAVNTSFAPAYVHSGDVSLKLQGDATHFVFSTATPALQGGHPYFLEFWTTTSQGAGSGVGYAVFDSANNAYFNPDSGWTYIESVSSNDPVTDRGVIDTMLKGDSDPPAYVHYITYFTALPNAKIELRFYPPSSGAGYVDDVSIVEAKDFSLSFWVKANGSEAGSSLVNKMGTEAGADQGISIGFPSPLQLNASFASAHQLAGADCMNTPATFDECKIWLPADLSDANWHLVSIVAQRLGNATVYVDGARQATHTFRLGRLNNSVGHRLGYTGTANSFSGYLDEVRLHRRALSAAEASDAYRLRLQANCTATLTATYSGVPEGVPLSAAYNANLKIRNSFPSILLSMPFDADITTNQSGAVPDYSGFMRAGTLSGGISWTPDGRVGGAYSFDNDSSAISFPTPLLSGAADFTLSAWVKPNAAGPYYIMGNYGVGNPAGVRLLVDSGRPVLLIGSTALSSTLAAPAGQWTHVAATRSGGVAAIYVNSISGGTAPIPDPIGQDANFMIGSSPDILDVFGGEIDEVRVYERALSDSEIYSLYYDLPLLYNGTVPSHAGR